MAVNVEILSKCLFLNYNLNKKVLIPKNRMYVKEK